MESNNNGRVYMHGKCVGVEMNAHHYGSLVFCISVCEIKAGPDTIKSGAEEAAPCLSALQVYLDKEKKQTTLLEEARTPSRLIR